MKLSASNDSRDGAALSGSWAAELVPGEGSVRRAVSIARHIEQDLHANGWPFGAVCGSQHELRQRYDAGDESLREAIRVLEFNGVARMRPGPGGGLVVERPSLCLVVAACVGYCRGAYAHVPPAVTLQCVNAARASLVTVAVRVANERAVAGGGEIAARLRRLLSIPHIADFPMALATALDDPCLRLLAYVLHRLGHACGRVESSKRNDSQVADSVADSVAARKVLAAIAAGETLGAALRARILSLMDPVR